MGAVMYGDLIPFALSEQLFTFIAMFTARIFLAFLYAEAASYLSSIHSAYANHIRKINIAVKWMKLHHMPQALINRTINYHENLWHNFKGISESDILRDLPECLA